MYQLEVKRWLVAYRFPPSEGWRVRVDIDAMERAISGQHKPGKAERARAAESALLSMGATIGTHPEFGRADIVAEYPTNGLLVIEVEGNSSRQKEQAVYSALGQLVLQMQGTKHGIGLAVPDETPWEKQLLKIPKHARVTLGLSCVLVSELGVGITLHSTGPARKAALGCIFSQSNTLVRSHRFPTDCGTSAVPGSHKCWVGTALTYPAYQVPVFSIESHGSAGANGEPFCNNSIEILSGERTNAMCPSRGGRLINTPASINF